MANTSELCESIELRLQQVLDETGRLQRALDALGSSTGRVATRAFGDDMSAAAANTAAPPAATPSDSPPRRAIAASPQLRPETDVPGPAERAVLALRAELDAGLRTTAV